jgi:predicted porin
MQKKIIALAVAAAFSTPAFADVGFYGIVDGAVAYISGKDTKSDLIAASGAASQSRLGVKATEDLGNGLTGVAVLEYGLDSQDGTAIGAPRQTMLAVAGDFGTVATGYLQTAAYDFLAKYDPIYGSGSSAHSIVAKTFLVGKVAQRAPRAVAYISPNISGLTVAANYSTALVGLGALGQSDIAPNNQFEKKSAYLLSANYTLDALSLGAVYASASDSKTAAGALTNGATEFAVGGSYDLGVAKLMGTYQSQTSTAAGAKASTVISLAGVVPVATGAVAAMYGTNSIGGVSANSASAFTAGYLHTFTKSTTGYVVYSQVTNGSATNAYSVSSNALAGAVSNGGGSSLFGIGLRKKF